MSNWLHNIRRPLMQVRGLPEHPNPWLRYTSSVCEAFFLTAIALTFTTAIAAGEAAFFGLFLAAASLTGRFDRILQENKDRIFVEKVPSFQANARTALRILMVFIGMCAAYLASAILSSEAEFRDSFGLILEITNNQTGTLFDRDFSHIQRVIINNLMVMGSIAVVCLLYRSYGALLTLGWNAAVWIVVLSGATMPILTDDVWTNIGIVSWTIAAIGPHLLGEGAAYVLVALAAIFYSKGFTKYMLPLPAKDPSSLASVIAMELPKDDVFYSITISCIKLLVAAILTLLLAALLEGFYAPAMLSQLRDWLGG